MRNVIALIVVAAVGFFGFRMYHDKTAQEPIQQAEIAAKQAAAKADAVAKHAAAQALAAATQAAEQAHQAASDPAQQLSSLEAGSINAATEITNLIQQATAALSSITDQVSAEVALPSLDALKDKVTGVGAQIEQLSAEGKKLLASVVSTALPSLKELAARASSIQGVDAIKPSIDAMLAKLEAWANAQG